MPYFSLYLDYHCNCKLLRKAKPQIINGERKTELGKKNKNKRGKRGIADKTQKKHDATHTEERKRRKRKKTKTIIKEGREAFSIKLT